MRTSLLVATLLTLPTLAHAERWLDDATLDFSLDEKDGGSYVKPDLTIWGAVGSDDAVRLDLKRGGKTIASERCGRLAGTTDESSGLEVSSVDGCTTTPKPLTPGEYTIDVVYVDDATDKETLMRSVKKTAVQVGDDKGHLEFLDHDTLGLAYLRILKDGPDLHWFHSFGGERCDDNIDQPTVRCSVDGKRLELGSGIMNKGILKEIDWRVGKTTGCLGWAHYRMSLEIESVTEHDGAWVCELRSKGDPIRRMKFAVKGGKVVPHKLQSAPDGIRLGPDRWFVEQEWPATHGEFSVQPSAIKATVMGRAWPAGAAAVLGGLPKATGPARLNGK
jgi:hypothetical protein